VSTASATAAFNGNSWSVLTARQPGEVLRLLPAWPRDARGVGPMRH
jgi:hypothetical protein